MEKYKKTILETEMSKDKLVDKFVKCINAEKINENSFIYNNERWLIQFHPSDHSSDIIIQDTIIDKYDNFLLVKHRRNRVSIEGWTTNKQLKSTMKRDIYSNGKNYFVVFHTNINDLTSFKIKSKSNAKKVLKTKFIINQQKAENLGHSEMTGGILAGLRHFAKEAKLNFKDINQVDECILGDEKVKIFTRDAMSDEDMLIPETFFQKNQDVAIFILCKIKAGNYSYVGYVKRDLVDETRIVQMIGDGNSTASEEIRRIFSDQYLNLSDYFKIYEEEKEEEKIDDPQSYIPLHMHSEFSIGDGFGTINYICDNLRCKGFKSAALTDHGSLAGAWAFQKAMLERDLKPILGCEIYTKLDGIEQRFHSTVLVKNKIGWQNLLKLHAYAVRKGFYYKPIIPFEMLLENAEGLILLSGCSNGPIPTMIKNGKNEKAKEILLNCKKVFGDNFYAEFMLHDIEKNQEVMEKLYNLTDQQQIKCVLTTDTHYSNREDIRFHEAIKAISMKKMYGEAGYSDEIFYLLQDKDIEDLIKQRQELNWLQDLYKNWMTNTFEIMDKIDFKIEPPKEDDTLPKYLPSQDERKLELKKFCLEGLEKFTPYKYENEIKERLDLEIGRMLIKGYENYFLIVWDLVKWAKENGIRVGPGRGSIGSSLAAFALNITECDPIKHDLLFDRFLSPIRRDMPDADLDFMDRRRQEVFNYLREKYGENNCAKVVTYSRFHPKGILRDIGRIFEIPSKEINKICSMVLERSGGDARASFGLIDTFDEFPEADAFRKSYPLASEIAVKLETHIRHKGIHAAAMVVSEKDIGSYAPINRMRGEIVTEWEKQLVEDMKLVKFDILGLKTLTVIDDTVNMSNCELPKTFDDQKVYKEVFQTGNNSGIFQFEGVGLSKLGKSIGVKKFSELCDCTSLYRPGTLHAGTTAVYVNRIKGAEKVEPLHPLLGEITKNTQGIILYQEQTMKVMNQIGCMSWAAAETVRKIITKSKGQNVFKKMRAEFIQNACHHHKMEEEMAEKIFDTVSMFGNYGFNEAHAVEYSMLSYYCAWLKVYYPLEFYCAILKNESDKASLFNYIQDANNNNIDVEFPDINKSIDTYSIIEGKIHAGFDSIVGIATKTAQKIIKNQPYESFEDFIKRAKVSDKILKGLIVADIFRSFNINKKVCFNKSQKEKFNPYDKFTPDFNEIEHTKLVYQFTTLKSKLNIKETFNFGNYDFKDISNLEDYGGKQVIIRGLITDVINKDKLLRGDLKKHEHQFEQHLIFLNINDGTGDIACQINPWTYEIHSKLLEDIDRKAVIAIGILGRDGKKMYCDLLEIVDESDGIKKLYDKIKKIEGKERIIVSASPAVSKKGKSYYRITLNDGTKGLCFRFNQKFFPGMKVEYAITTEPFINLNILEEVIK